MESRDQEKARTELHGYPREPANAAETTRDGRAVGFLKYPYHQAILENEIPLSIGGGIGQSRTLMLLLRKAHLGEVSVSVWPKIRKEMCARKRIYARKNIYVLE